MPAGERLEIAAGVQVRFERGTGLQVSGTLVTNGVAGANVVFTSLETPSSPGDWIGVTIGVSAVAQLAFTEIAFAQTGLQLDRATVSCRQCLVHSSSVAGIAVSGGDTAFEECSVLWGRSAASVPGVLIGTGTTTRLVRCLVAGNNGHGVDLAGNSRATLDRCEVRQNGLVGVVINTGAEPAFSGCNLYGNALYEVGVGVGWTTPAVIDARGTWWGTTSLSVIENRIQHEPDGGNRARIWYEPISLVPNAIGNPAMTPTPSRTPSPTATATATPTFDPVIPTPPSSAPRWAVLSRDTLLLMRQAIGIRMSEQNAQGSFSNGTDPDNDVENIPPFNGFYLLTQDEQVLQSAIRCSDWLWNNVLYRGFDRRGTNEAHHGGELSWNCYPFLMTRYGEQKWIDRVNTMTELLPIMTGYTPQGRRHFRSFHWDGFGNFRVDSYKDVDIPENGRYMPAFFYAVWNNPQLRQQGMLVRDMLLEHGNAWHALAMSSAPDKPVGVVPYEVVFSTGAVAGYSRRWWAMKASLTSPSSDFNWDWRYGMVAPRSLYYQLFSDYFLSGNAKYLEPVDGTIRYFFRDVAVNGIPPAYMNIFRNEDDADGTWPVVNHLGNAFTDIIASIWRTVTQNTKYDREFVLQADRALQVYGSGGGRYARLNRQTLQFDTSSWQYDNGPTTPLFLGWTASHNLQYLEKCLEWVRESYALKLARNEGGIGTIDLSYLLLMYTGGASPAKRIYPHNAFSWENTRYRHAAMILERSEGHVRMWTYNFDPEPLAAQLRIWEMKPGTYRVRRGPDADRNGIADTVEAEWSVRGVSRGTLLDLPLSPQRLEVISLQWLDGEDPSLTTF